MKQIPTTAIILKRIEYGEADRILTLLTPDHGKISLMARGVRRIKSKLAGGIELFSISDITFMRGRGELGTLISSRLQTHYGHIVKDIERVQLGYEMIKMLDRATEDEPEPEYFRLLNTAFKALDDGKLSLDFLRLWFPAQLLAQSGHEPNLQSDTTGKSLAAGAVYNFDMDAMTFTPHLDGRFTTDHIKALRLLFGHNNPAVLAQVQGITPLLPDIAPLIHAMRATYIRV